MIDYLFTKTPLLFFTQDLWRDEGFSYDLANRGVGEIISLTVQDFNPPLYYIVLHYWMQIFGTSEVAMRSLSFVLFALFLYACFEILYMVFSFSRRKATVYTFFIGLQPFLLSYAFEARMYIAVALLTAVAYFAFWKNKKKLHVLVLVLGLFTHYFMALVLLSQAIETFISTIKKEKQLFRKKNWKTLVSKFSVYIISSLLFLPWLVFFLSAHASGDSSFWIIRPPLKDVFYMPFVLFTGYERVFGQYYHDEAGYTFFHLLCTLLLFFIISYGLWQIGRSNNKKQKRLAASLVLLTFGPPLFVFIISYIWQSYYLPRYLIYSSVGIALLIPVCIESFRNRFLKLGAIFLLLWAMVHFHTLNLEYRSKRNISGLYREIQANLTEDDRVYVTDVLFYFLARYYIPGEEIYIYQSDYEDLPQYVGKALIPPDHTVRRLPLYPAKAFLIYYDYYKVESRI